MAINVVRKKKTRCNFGRIKSWRNLNWELRDEFFKPHRFPYFMSESGTSSCEAIRFELIDSPEMEEKWTTVCEGESGTCFYHGLPWRDLIAEEYGFTPLYYIARCGTRVAGLLPLFLIDNLTGRKLVTPPFSMYGGLHSDDVHVQQAMLGHVQQLSRDIGVRRISVRLSSPDLSETHAFAVQETDSIVETAGQTYVSYEQSLRPRVRTYIRQAVRMGYIVTTGNDDDLLTQFYQLLTITRQRQRLPIPRISYIRRIASLFRVHFVVVTLSGRPVSAAMTIEDRSALYFAYLGRIARYEKGNPTFLVYAEMVKMAIDRQLDALYLGGSNTSSLLGFKQKWNPVHRPLLLYSSPDTADRSNRKSGIPFWNYLPSRLQAPASYCLLRYFY